MTFFSDCGDHRATAMTLEFQSVKQFDGNIS